MRAVYALMLAGLSCASPIFSTERVNVQAVQAGEDKMVEVDLTESTVNEDGLMVQTSVSFSVEVSKGVAIINDQYAVPVGVGKFTVETTVQEFELMPSGLRMATATEQVPVALSVGTQVAFDFEGHLHLQLEVLEAEGMDLSTQHYTEVELVLDENMNEQARIHMQEATPIAPKALEQAEDVPAVDVASSEDSSSDEFKDLEDFQDLLTSKPKCKVIKWYNNQPVGVRVGVTVAGAATLALIAALLAKCIRCCCCAKPKKSKGRAPPKGKFYVRNIQAASNKRAFIPLKQYKFQKVPTNV